jgi:hypothetical protein
LSVSPSTSASASSLPVGRWSYSEWSSCSASCGGGVRSRVVSCVASDGQSLSRSRCFDQPRPMTWEVCNSHACPSLRWMWRLPSENVTEWLPFGPCSQPCSGSDGSDGVSVRDAPLCYYGMGTVSESVCESAGLPRPLTSMPCNRFPCPLSQHVWRVGEWGPCVSNSSQGRCVPGVRSRVVSCELVSQRDSSDASAGGQVVDSALCSSGAEPSSESDCAAESSKCGCTSASECLASLSSNSVCDVASGQCRCVDGWLGDMCSVPALVSSSGEVCRGGVVDIIGVCCDSTMVVNASGHCCGAGFAAVDASGRCCASSADIDACGVCGGDSVALDVEGTCCRSVLPPSGRCCADAAGQPVAVDDCGVCGGVHHCGADVELTIELSASVTPDAPLLLMVSGALADALSLPSSSMSNVTMTRRDFGSDAHRLLSRDHAQQRRVRGAVQRRTSCVSVWGG